MKKERLKKADLLLILILLAAAAFAALYNRQDAFLKSPVIVIEQNGMELYRLPLGQPLNLQIASDDGDNRIAADLESVWVEEADCPDQICVKQGKITDSGQTIVCLPHKLVIYLEGIKQDTPDVILK